MIWPNLKYGRARRDITDGGGLHWEKRYIRLGRQLWQIEGHPEKPAHHRKCHRGTDEFLFARAQQAHEADLAIESFCEDVFGFEAFQVQFGHTAAAARRLMRHPLGPRHSTCWYESRK